MTINTSDIYVYMLREKGLSGRMTLKLCKLIGDIENIMSFDINEYIYKRLSEGLNEQIEEKDLIKISSVIKKLKKEESELKEKAKLFYSDLMSKDVKWTHLAKDDYPKRLFNIADPPLILFYRGKLPEEKRPSVAIVGARECSSYGENVARIFARELSVAGVQIISGMARGVDGISQRNSIEVGGATFGILGCGVDVVYPKENRDIFDSILNDGGLISEFEPGVMPIRKYFPSRNRIISGLSDIVLVVEARKKSGTYITVTQALEQGRDVYAVPGRITDALSDGCNSLIASGAGIALSSDSILDELKNRDFILGSGRISSPNDSYPETSDDISVENSILKYVRENDMTLDALYRSFAGEISIEDLSITLVDLETEGKIKKIGGRYTYIPLDFT